MEDVVSIHHHDSKVTKLYSFNPSSCYYVLINEIMCSTSANKSNNFLPWQHASNPEWIILFKTRNPSKCSFTSLLFSRLFCWSSSLSFVSVCLCKVSKLYLSTEYASNWQVFPFSTHSWPGAHGSLHVKQRFFFFSSYEFIFYLYWRGLFGLNVFLVIKFPILFILEGFWWEFVLWNNKLHAPRLPNSLLQNRLIKDLNLSYNGFHSSFTEKDYQPPLCNVRNYNW